MSVTVNIQGDKKLTYPEATTWEIDSSRDYLILNLYNGTKKIATILSWNYIYTGKIVMDKPEPRTKRTTVTVADRPLKSI